MPQHSPDRRQPCQAAPTAGKGFRGKAAHSGYDREHAIATLQEFGYTKMIRFPSGTGTIPTWRGVTDVYDTAVC